MCVLMMYVCMLMCVHVCMYKCVCTYVCACVYVSVCVHVCVQNEDHSIMYVLQYRDVLEMTFHSESRKVRQVVLGMTLTSQLLKKGDSMYVHIYNIYTISNIKRTYIVV